MPDLYSVFKARICKMSTLLPMPENRLLLRLTETARSTRLHVLASNLSAPPVVLPFRHRLFNLKVSLAYLVTVKTDDEGPEFPSRPRRNPSWTIDCL